MIECLVSWVIIFVTAYLWGNVCLGSLAKINRWLTNSNKKEKINWKIDDCIIAGMCMLTVYAQVFSIFYKVGAIALLLVIAADIVFFFIIKAQLILKLKQCFLDKDRVNVVFGMVICAIIGITVLKLTALPVRHYDSSLYHAQSIRWIEEYGIVKGLGNLHNRLAYNSSFFAFQALFSFSFLLGKSLHTVNGLITVVFLCYAVCSAKVWKNKKFAISDFVRLGIVIYLLSETLSYSSPGSDILALGLVLYIMCKWISYWEDRENRLLLYTELCILAVWAVSVKLSASMVVFLAIYPTVSILKNKEWKQLVLYILTGVGIILPFLIRNVLISGYLIYPYPELNIFDVDWKMPAYTLLFDRNEISAWGKGLRDVFRFDEPFDIWFPVWYETLGELKKWWWITIASSCFVILKSIYKIICSIHGRVAHKTLEDALQYTLIVFVMIGCMLLWFLGAPLPRYGAAYFYMISLFCMGELIVSVQGKIHNSMVGPICFAFVFGLLAHPLYEGSDRVLNVLRAPDYETYKCDEILMESYSFYVPSEGDQAGYSAFPSTPYRGRLDLIEFRGSTINEGFRMKNEYKEGFVSTYGDIYNDNMFN